MSPGGLTNWSGRSRTTSKYRARALRSSYSPMTEHSTADIVGAAAGVLTTIAFVPQVIRTWRTRRATDFSLAMLVVFNTGVFLWGVYGWLAGAVPVIAANVVTLVLSLSMLTMKIRYSR